MDSYRVGSIVDSNHLGASSVTGLFYGVRLSVNSNGLDDIGRVKPKSKYWLKELSGDF